MNTPRFTDSPRASPLYAAQQTESPAQLPQALESESDSPEGESSDKLSAAPQNAVPSTPHRSIRDERSAILASSAPLRRSPLAARAFPIPGGHTSASTPNRSPRAKIQVHPLLRETVSESAGIGGIDSAMTRMSRSSDPVQPSSAVRSSRVTNSPRKQGHESPRNGSAPHSRATSPMRLFSWPAFHRTQEDPFVPIDPFRIRNRFRHLPFHSPDIEHNLPLDSICGENLLCCIPPLRPSTKDRFLSFLQDARYFILDTVPRQLYLHLLLRLPSLYFSRIARVYESAQLSKPDLDRMIEFYTSSGQQQQRQRIIRSSPIPPGAHRHQDLPFPDEWTTTNVSPTLLRFKQSWEAFINSLLREWKTLNLVSALLLTAILSMFQNQVMATDPVIRTAALLSLTSALISLSYGCIYIVRFGTMRSMHKATRWAEEAARTTTFILWNVWVLLSMPAVWLAWSMIFFIVAILAFVWRNGSSTDPVSPQPLNPTPALGPRIAVSALFLLGLVYFGAIVKTLHNYGRTTNSTLFSRPDARETHAPREDAHESREERGTGPGDDERERGREPTRGSRGRERERRERARDVTEPGGLSAMTGLGLTGLDELASGRGGLDETPG